MEPCPYRQGEPPVRAAHVVGVHPGRNGALPLSAGRAGEALPGWWLVTWPQWSPALIGRESGRGCCSTGLPRRCRNGALPLSAGRGHEEHRATIDALVAAMEPCPYRQGEAAVGVEGDGRGQQPQWSPALIGRERSMRPAERADAVLAAMEPCPYRQGEIFGRVVCRLLGGRNGALPLSAGRAALYAIGQSRGVVAAMEPCPYRQGEPARTRRHTV